MRELFIFIGMGSVAAVVLYAWRLFYVRSLVLERLDRSSTSVEVSRDDVARRAATLPVRSPLARTWRWLPWVLMFPAGVILFFVGLPWMFCVSLGVISGLLGSQLESWWMTRRATQLESQLADSVDIMVGALGAGAGVAGAMEAAIQESGRPLRRQLEEVAGRIRLGDQPQAVFQQLAQRIPLETFLLFASTLAVHWEVGGSLAPTLATVGRTIRDRIDISRRIRSNTAQSQISTFMILGLTYFIALVVYSNGPDQMREFLATSIGGYFAAGSMLLQAVGIVWMSYISRMKF